MTDPGTEPAGTLLADWQRWQRRSQGLTGLVRAARSRLRPQPPQTWALSLWPPGAPPRPGIDHAWAPTADPTKAPKPRILVVLDADTPTQQLALIAPLAHLDPHDVCVLAARATGGQRIWRSAIPTRELIVTIQPGDRLIPDSVRVVVAVGHYLPIGAAAYAAARARGLPFVVVQHGLLTPFAPPLPPGAHLLAWSDADAAYWSQGRTDVTSEVVGSHLLYAAAQEPAGPVPADAKPTYLGQLHGAELPRRGLAAAAYRFCREQGATYRPHPAERDRLSRALHAAWRRRGIVIDRSGRLIGDPPTPVVGVFSTGLLEAAARGLPAWVHYPDPPQWLREFWSRYGLAPWGGPPTAAPAQPAQQPAALIAARLSELAKEPP